MVKKYAEKLWETLKKLRGHITRRALALACAVLVIGCAVTLNFFLSKGESEAEKREMALDLTKIPSNTDEGAPVLEDVSESEDYFATITLGRKQARDEAMEVLLDVSENADALPEARADAAADINRIALDIEREGKIEAMVTSRGFERCVAMVSGDIASVVVSADALTPGQAAQISEIVYEASGIVPANLKIIEKSIN